MSTKYVSGRVRELKIGITSYSESKESLSVVGRISGIATNNVIPFLYSNYSDLPSATTYHGAFAHVHATQKAYFAHGGNWIELVNKETSGTVGTGTERYNIGPVDLTTLDVSGISTFADVVVSGVSTYQSPLDIESSVLITGITTIGGLVDINAGGQANTFKVEDLTDNRVVIAGTGGELEDSANLTFDGTTFNVGSGVTIYQASGIVSATSFYGDGSSLTGIDASSLSFGGVVKAQANQSGVVVTGVLTATTFSGSGASLDTLNASELDSGTIPDARFPATLPAASGVNLTALNATNLGSGTVPDARFPATLPAISGANLTNLPTGINTTGTSDFATLNVSTLLDVDGHTDLDDLVVAGVATFSALVDGNAGANFSGAETTLSSATVSDLTNTRVVYAGAGGSLVDSANLTFDGSTLTANAFAGNGAALTNLSIPGISTGTTSEFSNLDLSGTLSVGGTSIFNSPIVGVATFSGAVTADAGLTASTAKISDLTDNRIVIAGTSGELEDTTKLTFDGSTLTVVGDASFTGNVSVAGTLTSEEKTNIDSIGIVTARTGVRVNSGGLVVTSGVSTFSDSVVASSAKVSDLTSGRVVVAGTAGELQDASTFTFSGGTVTASAFSGDGSALTGITAAGTGAIGGITVKDEGVTVGTAGSVSSFDFRGSYITAIASAGAAGVATVTVSETPSFTTVNVTGISTFASHVGFTTGVHVGGISTFSGIRVQDDSGNNDVIIDNDLLANHVFITLKDNCKAQFGNGTDLQIYHGGSDSYVIDQGVGNLILGANDAVRITDGAGSENKIVATTNGSVDLYYDNVKKIETTTHGVVVTGIVTATDVDSTSDIRLKTNIQTIENPLAKVIQIEGVSFNWKEDNRPALGVIADQVQEILPELVHGDDPKTVNYNGLIGLLIEAVKEQQIQIDELKSKLP